MWKTKLAAVLLAGATAIACGRPAEPEPEETAPSVQQPATRVSAPAPSDPVWTYEGDTGPDSWGALSPKFAACGEGSRQSPMDLSGADAGELPEIAATFRSATLRIVHHEHIADAINSGHTVQVNYPHGDTLKVGSSSYDLVQYHFHAPSEHTVDAEHYPMEMHMVHRAEDGSLAVVGAFIEMGTHNAAFDPIWSNLPQEKGVETHFESVSVDVDDLLPQSQTTYRYSGSLTTPPCSEGVEWFVMATPIALSAEQIAAFTELVRDNNRPVQPRNDRTLVTDRISEES